MKLSSFLNEGISQARARYLKLNKKEIDKELEKQLIEVDPTPQKKYVDWIVKVASSKYGRGELKDLSRFKKALIDFEELTTKNQIKQKDIYSYKNLEGVVDVTLPFKMSNNKVETKSSVKKDVKVEGAEKVFSNDKVNVYHIKSHAASKIYGMNAPWCVAMQDDSHYWDNYTSQVSDGCKNTFYYVIKKNPEGDYSNPKKPSGNYKFDKLAVEVQSETKRNIWDSSNSTIGEREFQAYCKNMGIPM